MTALEVLREFRRLVQLRTWDVPVLVDLDAGAYPTLAQALAPLPELESAAQGDGNLVADALGLLDSATPSPWTFMLFHDGAEWAEINGTVEIIYKYDRTKMEILAVIGKACMRAQKRERAA